jgi:hypothetical protein
MSSCLLLSLPPAAQEANSRCVLRTFALEGYWRLSCAIENACAVEELLFDCYARCGAG